MRASRFFYLYHFAALASVAAALLAAGHPYRPHNALVVAAVYGALYSTVTACTRRSGHTVGRKLSFIVAAALCSSLCVAMSYYGGRWLGWSMPIDYLVVCAGAGGGSYTLLLRGLLIPELSLRALLLITPISVFTVVAVYLSGLHSRNIDVLAVSWWFGFSAGLWFEDCLSSRVFQAGIH